MKKYILYTFLGLVLSAYPSITQAHVEASSVAQPLTIEKNVSNQVSYSKPEDVLNSFSTDKKNKDIPLSIKELTEKADNGDIDAQLDLGYTYLYGIDGVNIDYKLAFHYYEMAAIAENNVALNNLGSLYFSGIGTQVNYNKAIDYFKKAVKAGSNDAAVNLAIIYLGDKVKSDEKKDYEKIFSLLKDASKDNNVAKYLLGYSYYRGFYVKKDIKKAFHLIKEIADAGYDEAQFVLSDFYIKGKAIPKNYSNAVDYLRMAVKQGYAAAFTKLGSILSDGKIFKKDIAQAHILFNIASVKNEKHAAEKRDLLEKELSIDTLLKVQADAENYKEEPTEFTQFVRQTFGNSLKIYIDTNLNNSIEKKSRKK